MTVSFSVLSPQQVHVLTALRRFRFLSVEQMRHLGISKSANVLRDKTLFALRHGGYVQSEKIGCTLPHVHALLPKGAEILAALEGGAVATAPNPKHQPHSALFAPHRTAQVDVHIGITQWAEQRGDVEMILELQDFVRTPKPATELTAPGLVNTVIPDGLFAVSNPQGQEAVFVIEVHRSTQSKAVTAQLSQYFEVITSGVINATHDVNAHPIICSIHQQPAVLASVKARLLAHEGFAPFRQNFVFRQLDGLRENFTTGWHLADDTPANPFPVPNPPRNEQA